MPPGLSPLSIPPLLTPIQDETGKVRDARAEQVTSLDASIAAVEQARSVVPPTVLSPPALQVPPPPGAP